MQVFIFNDGEPWGESVVILAETEERAREVGGKNIVKTDGTGWEVETMPLKESIIYMDFGG